MLYDEIMKENSNTGRGTDASGTGRGTDSF